MKWILSLACALLFFLSSAQPPLQIKLPVVPQNFHATTSFSPDGKLLLSSEHQRTYLFDVVSGRTVYDFKNTSSSSFSADGKYLLLQRDKGVSVWEVATQKVVFHYPLQNSYYPASLTADNRLLVMVDTDLTSFPYKNYLITVDMASHKELYRKEVSGNILCLPNLSKTHLVATYDFSGKATVYHLLKGEPVYTLDLGEDAIRSFAFSPDDQLLALSTASKKINLYHAAGGKLLRTLTGHSGIVSDASFSHSGKLIASASQDKTIRLWEVASGKMLKEFKEESPVYKVSFSSKDNYLLAQLEYDFLLVRNIATGKRHNPSFLELAKYTGPRQISPDEQLFYASSQILRLSNGETVHQFSKQLSEIETTAVSTNGRYIATTRGLSTINIWDMAIAKQVAHFSYPDTSRYVWYAKDVKFADSNHLFIGWSNGELWNWDVENSRIDARTNIGHTITSLQLNKKRNQLLAISDSSVTALDVASFNPIYHFSNDSLQTATFHPVLYSPDESLLLVNGVKNAFLLDAKKGNVITVLVKEEWGGLPLISADNRKLVLVYEGDLCYVYELPTGKELTKLRHRWNNDQYPDRFLGKWAELADDGNSLFILAKETTKGQTYYQKWNLQTGQVESSFPFSEFSQLDQDGGDLVYLLRDDSLTVRKVSDLQPLKTVEAENFFVDTINKRVMVQTEFTIDVYTSRLEKIISLVSFNGDGGGLAFLPNNFYKTDPNAISKIHLQSGLNVISVNQLDVQLNRPDLVLDALQSKDSLLRTAYRTAFQKRLRKLSLPESFTENTKVPVAAIKNRNDIPSEQLGGTVKLLLSASDPSSPLDRYNVWVNDVPLFGSKGISIAKANTSKLETTVIVPLSKGANRIEFSVTNRQGKESFRQPLNVFHGSRKSLEEVHGYQSYDPKKPKEGTLYFIGIGIDQFQDSRYNLQWSVKDIRDLAAGLKDKMFDYDLVIDTLFNEQVTVNNVAALRRKLLSTKVNDKVILSYSGHGLLSDSFDYYLSTYTVDFKKPEKNGLPYEVLESLLDSIPSRHKLMLIDACHSGEVDKEEMAKYKRTLNEKAGEGLKGGEIINTDTTAKVGMKNSFELMQELFANVGRSTGATIISAAAGTQLAQERGELKNGVFTYAILEYMQKEHAVTVTELKNYVNKRVTELTNGLQVPTTRSETKAIDWKVW